ncbi:MAG: hypothetical protein V2I63_02435 [Pseudomonadales bacterium]|nr:hypothetical protein [Pseudomonadales bacterium]
MKTALATVLALGALTSATASASMIPRPDHRSLEACTRAIEASMPRARIEEAFHDRRPEGHRISANVIRYESGAWHPLRVTCETSTNGRRVLDLQAEAGRWIPPEPS